jgi:hypothetical protein
LLWPPSPRRLALVLTAAATLALALLAAVVLLALQLHFEARDRDQLQRELAQARQVLAGVDDTAALAAMPARLAERFDERFNEQAALAVRIQNPLGQPLYERLPAAAMPPALLAQPALAPPAPLLSWDADGSRWRGSALLMRMPLDGAAPLTVAVALRIERDTHFLQRLRWVLGAYVALAALALGALAQRAGRRPQAPAAQP